MRTFKWMVGLALTSAAAGSTALTIGPVRGPVWLQQKFDIVVPVQLEPGTPTDALCAYADLSFGESQVDRNQVQVAVESSATPDTASLRITSRTTVNEPVVTLVLQVGCEQRVVRQYVLLPDMPVLDTADSRRPSVVPESAVPVPLVAGDSSTTSPSESVNASDAPAPPAERPPEVKPRPPAVVVRPKPKPRLRLELQAPPPRRTAPVVVEPRAAELPLPSLGEQARPPEDAASAPQEAPDAQAQQEQRVQQLQGDIQLLLKQAAENDAKLADLRVRMEKAESDRATLASVLGGAVVVVLLAVAVAWWMRRRQAVALVDDPELDPEARDLIVDFNPVDADHWAHPPSALREPATGPKA